MKSNYSAKMNIFIANVIDKNFKQKDFFFLAFVL